MEVSAPVADEDKNNFDQTVETLTQGGGFKTTSSTSKGKALLKNMDPPKELTEEQKVKQDLTKNLQKNWQNL